MPDGPAAEPGCAVVRAALVPRQRWALGRMVLGGHRQVVLVRPAIDALVVQVLHYPEQVRFCAVVTKPAPDAASEEMRLAGMLIDAASGSVECGSYQGQAAQVVKALIEAKLEGQPVATLEPAPTTL